MTEVPVRERFVLRWDEETQWGHLGVVAGSGKPQWVGFVSLEDAPLFRTLAKESFIRGNMREVWFSGRGAV
jgi:hypothetical protein